MPLFVLRWHSGVFALLGLALLALPFAAGQQATKPYKVTIVEEKDKVDGGPLPIDPNIHVACQYIGNMALNVLLDKKPMTGDAQTLFLIDGTIRAPRTTNWLFALPDGPNQKKRHGGHTFSVLGDIRVNLTVEVVPGKPSQMKEGMSRRMDTLLIYYSIHNNGDVPHKVGCRLYLPIQLLGKSGALFASPATHPNKLLDGVLLQGEEVPPFLEVLEKPDLQNPGFKGIVSFQTGNKMEKPSKVVLTGQGVGQNQWEVPAVPIAGQSTCVCFWEPKEIAPLGKREIAVAYGGGIVCNEDRVTIQFGGSVEPHKMFTITAYVEDPIDGQHLTLQLPKVIELIDGKATQIVPLAGETGGSVVLWRCRLLQVGTYPIRIRSSSGVTQTRIVTVAAPD